mmetsp:Transcript_36872/g.93955  ORF Transcript_36872/g.93955 Transcript_36872/m.93955 type:complete len:323 (+) Transcript_36872:173-1141(+)
MGASAVEAPSSAPAAGATTSCGSSVATGGGLSRSLNWSMAFFNVCKAVFASSNSVASLLSSSGKSAIDFLRPASTSSAASHSFSFSIHSSWARSRDRTASFSSFSARARSSKRSAAVAFAAPMASSRVTLCSLSTFSPSSTTLPANIPRAPGASFKANGKAAVKLCGTFVPAKRPINCPMAFWRCRQSFLAQAPSFNGGNNSCTFAMKSSLPFACCSAAASASAAAVLASARLPAAAPAAPTPEATQAAAASFWARLASSSVAAASTFAAAPAFAVSCAARLASPSAILLSRLACSFWQISAMPERTVSWKLCRFSLEASNA